MAGLIETIAVVDKSGKAISSSKHLVNVWKEAKAAYFDRKAEVAATRNKSHHKSGRSDHRTLKDGREHYRSAPSSPTHSPSHHRSSHRRASPDRRRSSTSVHGSPTSPFPERPSSHRHSSDVRSPKSPMPGIRRSQTADNDLSLVPRKSMPVRSMTTPSSPTEIDMDLAYGDLPPSPGSRNGSPDQRDLLPLVGNVSRLLEEADCLQHSAMATIASLQKNPEAMAAVALALAEVSNLVRKMAPTALISIRNSAPAVFGLLTSPQFLIAGGVAVGLTVVAFGGYKIIKRLKAEGQLEKEQSVDEMLEIGGDLKRIEHWRRGVAESDLASLDGTSVEGELITPHAHALSKLNLEENNWRQKTESLQSGSSRGGSRHHKERERKVEGSSKVSSSTKKGSSTSRAKKERDGKEKKEKKPSPLRLMFK